MVKCQQTVNLTPSLQHDPVTPHFDSTCLRVADTALSIYIYMRLPFRRLTMAWQQ